MIITNEQAEYLLKLPKKVIKEDEILETLLIDQKFPLHELYELISQTDDNLLFVGNSAE